MTKDEVREILLDKYVGIRLVDEKEGFTQLHLLAQEGHVEVLDHPDYLAEDFFGYNCLHFLCWEGREEVLRHPLFTKQNLVGVAPIHLMCFHDQHILELLKHPLVDKLKDNEGKTPLHFMTEQSGEGIEYCMKETTLYQLLLHESIDKVFDYHNCTPLHYLIAKKDVPLELLKDRYPWYPFGEKRLSKKLLTDILSWGNAEKFICGEEENTTKYENIWKKKIAGRYRRASSSPGS